MAVKVIIQVLVMQASTMRPSKHTDQINVMIDYGPV